MKFDIPTKKAGSFEMPALGVGTWLFGGADQPDYSLDEHEKIGLRIALDAGITAIDTAEFYSAGHAEELIGEVIRDYDRSKLFITSKVPSIRLGYDDVLAAAQRSLTRLKTDYIDLYLVHGPNDGYPIEETMRAMDELVSQGFAKNIGVSNFVKEQIEEAQKVTKNKIVNNQIHYNIGARALEDDGTFEYCRQNNVLVTAFRPIEKGLIEKMPGGSLLAEVGKKYGKTAIQVALNWVMNVPNVVTTFKSTNPEHLQEDFGCLGWQLSAEDHKYLADNFPRFTTHIYSQKYAQYRKSLRDKK